MDLAEPDCAQPPLVWLLQVDGMIVDIRTMQGALQEAAFAKGLIPYVPQSEPKDRPDDP